MSSLGGMHLISGIAHSQSGTKFWSGLLKASGVTGRGRGGRVSPQRLLTGKFLLTYWEKRGKENRENGTEKKENWKWKEESYKKREKTFFFFFCSSLFKTTEICFGSIKMGIFYSEKAFHAAKKSGKMTLPPSEKYACYAPAQSQIASYQYNPVLQSTHHHKVFPVHWPFLLSRSVLHRYTQMLLLRYRLDIVSPIHWKVKKIKIT